MSIELIVLKCDYPGCENRTTVFSLDGPDLADVGWERRGVSFIGMRAQPCSYVCREHCHVSSEELFRLTDK